MDTVSVQKAKAITEFYLEDLKRRLRVRPQFTASFCDCVTENLGQELQTFTCSKIYLQILNNL